MISNRILNAAKNAISLAKNPQIEFEKTLDRVAPADYFRLAWFCSQHKELSRIAFGLPFPTEYKFLLDWNEIYERTLAQSMWWIAATARVFKSTLSVFVKLEREFSTLTLAGKHGKAGELLDLIEKETGRSLWLLEARIANLELQGGVKDQKRYSQSIKEDDSIPHAVRVIAHFTSYRTEANVTPERYFDAIEKSFSDDTEEDEQTSTRYFIFRLALFGKYRFKNLAPVLIFEEHASLIDRYLTLVRVIQLIVCDDDLKKYRPIALAVSSSLYSTTNDPKILVVQALLGNNSLTAAANPPFLRLLDAYTKGDYNEVLMHPPETFEQDCQIASAELRAKASIRVGRPYAGQAHAALNLGRIELLLNKAFRRGGDCLDAHSALLKLILLYPQSRWAADLNGCLSREFSQFAGSSHTRQARFGLVNSAIGNPRLNTELNSVLPPVPVEATAPGAITLELLSVSAQSNPATVSKLTGVIPRLRLGKYFAIAHLGEKRYSSAIPGFLDLLDSSILLDNEDGVTGLVDCLLEYGDPISSFDRLVLSIAERPALLSKIKIQEFWKWARAKFALGAAFERSLAIPVLCDIVFGKIADVTEGERSALLEDYLLRTGHLRPSSLSAPADPVQRQLLVHLLRNLAVPNVLDSHVEYESSLDVENERIATCQNLAAMDPERALRYNGEIAQITRAQLIQRGVRQVEKSKIYVDIVGIKNSLRASSKDLFDRYRNLPRSRADLSNFVLRFENEFGKSGVKLLVSVPKNESIAAFNELFLTIRDRFVSSNEHGLDVYLSVGIRHGTLAGQLRSVFERESLVGRRAADNSFVIPVKWAEFFADTSDAPALHDLRVAIETFTDAVDARIRELRDQYIQIQTEEKPSKGWFDYMFTTKDLWSLETQSEGLDSFETFCDLVIEYLWQRTEKNLAKIRDRFTSEIWEAFASLLDRLSETYSSLPPSLGRMQFQAAITRVRPMMQAELASISGWFTRHGSGDVNAYRIDTAIDIARTMFDRCNPAKKLKVDLKSTGSPQMLNGMTLPGMVDIFYLLLDNIGKYGQTLPTGELRCGIKCSVDKEELKIEVQNLVAEDPARTAARKIEDIVKQIETNSAQERVKREGGTGLLKLAKIVRVDFGSALSLNAGFTRTKIFKVNFTASGGKAFS